MLTQQELVEGLTSLGETVTTQTLRNREKQRLITPSYKGVGDRPGRSVFYPDKCLWENYAAGKMLNSQRLRLTAKEVCAAREFALQMEKDASEEDRGLESGDIFEKIKNLPEHESLLLRFAETWHALFLYAREGCPKEWAAIVNFVNVVKGDECEPGYRETWDDTLHTYQVVTQKEGMVLSSDAHVFFVYSSGNYLKMLEKQPIDLQGENIVKIDM